MKISARNVLKGTVKSVEMGAVNVELTLEVAPGVLITSIITKRSCEELGLEVGKTAYAVIKASSVMLGVE
jgi:molybdate transport system regulatory protein